MIPDVEVERSSQEELNELWTRIKLLLLLIRKGEKDNSSASLK